MVDLIAQALLAAQLKSAIDRLRKACHRLGFKWELRIWQTSTVQEMTVGSDTPARITTKPVQIVLISNKPEEKAQQTVPKPASDSRGSTVGSV